MEDFEIIELYCCRSECAIVETALKYGAYCRSISLNMLGNSQDAEECVNDTYLHAWNAIAATRPVSLSAYLAKIVRNISIDCYKRKQTQKRGGGQLPLPLSELGDCIANQCTIEQALEDRQIADRISLFLQGRREQDRQMFVRRYWYGDSIREIAQRFCSSEEQVKSSIFRTRKSLKAYLQQQDIAV